MFFKAFLVVVHESNAVLGGWRLVVRGVKADGLTGVGGGLAMVC